LIHRLIKPLPELELSARVAQSEVDELPTWLSQPSSSSWQTLNNAKLPKQSESMTSSSSSSVVSDAAPNRTKKKKMKKPATVGLPTPGPSVKRAAKESKGVLKGRNVGVVGSSPARYTTSALTPLELNKEFLHKNNMWWKLEQREEQEAALAKRVKALK
jgi:hypothetical protein